MVNYRMKWSKRNRIKLAASLGLAVYLFLQLWLHTSLSPSSSSFLSLSDYLLKQKPSQDQQESVTFHIHFKQEEPGDQQDEEDPLLETSFIDSCLTAANKKNIQPYEDGWFRDRKPQLTSVVLAPPIYNNSTLFWHVIFNTASMQTKRGSAGIRPMYRHLWMRRGLWFCDGQPATPVGRGCPNGETLLLRCPQRILVGNGTSTSNNGTKTDGEQKNDFSSAPKSITTIRNDTYHIGDHVKCFLEKEFVKPKPNSVAANVLLFGDAVLHPRRLVEWMEYHRMIGVDHFFIYYSMGKTQSSASDNSFVLPHLTYTTYIPYDLIRQENAINLTANNSNKDDLKTAFRFQATQQMDAIFRARGLGYDWIVMTDMDEYLQFGDPNETLHNLTNRFLIDEMGNFTKIGGLSVQSTTYGASHGEPRFPDLMIDHIWKRRGLFAGERMKAIVRPSNVNYFAVHGITQGGKEVPVDPAIIRMAHYRHPELGVGFSKKPACDASLKELWHDVLEKRVAAIWNSMRLKYKSTDDLWTTESTFHNFHSNSATGFHSTN